MFDGVLDVPERRGELYDCPRERRAGRHGVGAEWRGDNYGGAICWPAERAADLRESEPAGVFGSAGRGVCGVWGQCGGCGAYEGLWWCIDGGGCCSWFGWPVVKVRMVEV